MRSPDSEALEKLFHDAAAIESDTAREALLSRADGDLAKVVRAMLEGARDPAWEQSALEIEARQTAIDGGPARAGEMFGPYRIVRRIATGGMSFVYEAMRDDAEFHMRVAIKFVQQGLDDPVAIERFRLERQILAQLEHPNIGRLLDGGATADGIPYLVMEYVEGVPLDVFAAGQWLTTAGRLKLFLRVSDAVQYAHRNLVVHRDLKPANILVTADGTPKLLDFGIAALLTADGRGQTMAALTPEFASPEQVLGRTAGTATDVYSLGVLLFVLLAGRLPYEASSPADLVRAICERDPAWELGATMDRDLRSIVALAMRKEPERRYASVEAFAADVRRYLEHRPVTARSGAVLYRAGKFVQRRAIAVGATVALLAAIGAGVAGTMAEARRVQRRFEDVHTLAHAVLFDLYNSIERLPGSLEARRLMASNAQQYLDRLSREGAGEPALVRDLAASYLRLGDVRGGPYGPNLGDTPGALDAYRKAQTLIEPLAAGQRADRETQFLLAQTLMRLGRVLNRQGRSEDALQVLRRAIAVLEGLSGRFATTAAYREHLARAYELVSEPEASIARRTRSVETQKSAVDAAQKAVTIEESAATDSGEASMNYLSAIYFNLGYRLDELAQMTGDSSSNCKALDADLRGDRINRRLVEIDPAGYRRQFADGLLSTGADRWRCLHDFAAAASDLQQALSTFEGLSAADPRNIEARRDLSNAHSALGTVLFEARRNDEAHAELRTAASILADLERSDPGSAENEWQLTAIRARLQELETRTRK